MKTKKYISLILALATISSFALVTPIFASGNQQGNIKNNVNNNFGQRQFTNTRDGKNNNGEMDWNKMNPAVIGKVSARNGNILTVISEESFNQNGNNPTPTFTVDATNAKLLRGNTAITLSDITIGDNIVVQGTITGTNIVATIIRDGKVGNGNSNENDNNQALLQIVGNDQPIVAGVISAINGFTLTITNSSNVIYTIDAANAKIVQGQNIILLSGVKTGDSVIVQGTVNGMSVVAATIIDTNMTVGTKTHYGFFGFFGQFFKHLFGF